MSFKDSNESGTKFRFKPEHFVTFAIVQPKDIEAAEKAQKVLDAHLATLPRVYGHENRFWGTEAKFGDTNDTHTALLWGITEIEKKECEEHDGFVNSKGELQISMPPVCGKCGVKLKARWEKA